MMRTIVWMLAGVLCLGQGFVSVTKADSDNIIYTKKARFRIPFQYESSQMPANGAKEVRLYLSVDQGGSWRHIKTVNPKEGKFGFEAAADGEYWFSVRTIDNNGKVFPPQNSMEAGLKVIVDRMVPVLNLNVEPVGPGNIRLAWNAQDSNLDPSTLKLEYYQNGSPQWQEVNILPKASGETTWSIPEGGTIAVRGTILDQASNIARQQTKAKILALNGSNSSVPSVPVNTMKTKPDLDDYSQPIASHTPVHQNPILSAPGVQNSITSVPRSFSQAPLLSVPSYGKKNVTRKKSGPIQIKPEKKTEPQKTNSNFVSGPKSTVPEITQPRFQPITAPEVSNVEKIHRSVKSRQFKIDYRVDDVGPSGVSTVVLYISQDQGQKWYRYGEDTDKTSPFHVTVPRDGLYSFALRVRSGAGLAYDPPQPGDQAEIVVNVDQTKPTAKFLPAYQGREDMTNKIMIRWEARDNQLADQPVSISYSEKSDGPWNEVSGWIDNTGQYVWNVEDGIPARIYLQMTVRDEAGNQTVVRTPSTVVVDMSKPTARIVDVQPDDNAR